jgi:uncharacterized iron-regulated membrane protein
VRRGTRAFIFKLHGWLGAKLFLVLFVILSTGALATVSNEIDWLLRPEMRAFPAERPVSWQVVYDSVRAHRPASDIDRIDAPIEPYFAIEVLTTTPDGAFERIYVDPATGRVQGSHGWVTVQRFLRNLHMGLFLPEYGILVVGSFGFLLIGSVATGLVVYKKFWRGFFKLPRRGDRRRLMGDLHRLGALWSLWFALLIGLTGVWYFAEDAMDYAWEREGPEVPAASLVGRSSYEPVSVARIEAVVRESWPTFRIDYISFPGDPTGPVTVGGHADAALVRSRGNLIYLHPLTGDVLRIKDATQVPLTERWVDTADPLHFGDFGGLATKLIWFVFGLGLSFLAFSGFWIMQARARRGRLPETAREDAPGALAPHPAE